MDFKILIAIFFVVLALATPPALMILSLKSDTEFLKGQVSTLQEWNLIPTSTDTLLDKRVDMLEQKMSKVYGGYSNIKIIDLELELERAERQLAISKEVQSEWLKITKEFRLH